MPTNVTIVADPLPASAFAGDLQQTLSLFATRLHGVFSGNVLTGQVNGSAPTSDMGIWINGNVLYNWNPTEARYLPIPLAIGRVATSGGPIVITSIQSNATANRTLYTPDKSGTIATTSDVFKGQPTQSLGGATPTVDWNIDARDFYLTLTANATIGMSNMADGQDKRVWVENPASATYTASFPNVIWAGGAAPTQTAGAAGIRKIDRYDFQRIGSYTFGKQTPDYEISTSGMSGGDVTAPTVSATSRNNSGGIVYVQMSEILQGGSPSTSDFTVTKSGASQAISSVTVSGDTITVDTATTFTSTNTVTVSYSGTSIKDVAGNPAASFGPLPVATTSGGGGGGGGGGQNVP